MKSQQEKAQTFEALHAARQCFVIPNPWDAGSARLLEHAGFAALATTGAGFAFSQARPDLTVGVEEMLPYFSAVCAATDLPVSADLQNGFGDDPQGAADAILAAARTGVVGASIEDASGKPDAPIYDLGLAVERIAEAARVARSLGFKFMLTARAENFLYGRADIKDTLRRLQAYQEAGADVLYAPGITRLEDIRTLVSEVDRPVNVLVGLMQAPVDLAQLAALGVARVSLGGSLARYAYGAMLGAARELLETGRFDYTTRAIPNPAINQIFATRP